MSLLAKLNEARAKAENGGIPIRRTDGMLYALLGQCLAICEEVLRDGKTEELRQAVEGGNRFVAGKGRRYVEANTDVYVMLGRYVLQGNDSRNSYYRYAATMREAGKRQISAADLPTWLATNGGVNALFKARPVNARTARTKTLNLNQQVTVPKDGPFTLVLRRDERGFFDVVAADPPNQATDGGNAVLGTRT